MWTYKAHPPHADIFLLLAVILLFFYASQLTPSSSFSILHEPPDFPFYFWKDPYKHWPSYAQMYTGGDEPNLLSTPGNIIMNINPLSRPSPEPPLLLHYCQLLNSFTSIIFSSAFSYCCKITAVWGAPVYWFYISKVLAHSADHHLSYKRIFVF
jgi:hypothetical protein